MVDTVNVVGDLTSDAINGVENIASDAINGVENIASDAINGVTDIVSDVLKGVDDITNDTLDGILDIATDVEEGLVHVVSHGFEGVADIVSDVVDNLKDLDFGGLISDLTVDLGNLATDVIRDSANMVIDVTSHAGKTLIDIAQDFSKTIVTVAQDLSNTITEITGHVTQMIIDIAEDTLEMIKAMGLEFVNFLLKFGECYAGQLVYFLVKQAAFLANAGKIRYFLDVDLLSKLTPNLNEYPKVDYLRIQFVPEATLPANWFKSNPTTSGMTFGNMIFLRRAIFPNKTEDIALLAHELVHTAQVIRFGGESSFGCNYGKGYAGAKFVYCKNYLEEEAYSFECINYGVCPPCP